MEILETKKGQKYRILLKDDKEATVQFIDTKNIQRVGIHSLRKNNFYDKDLKSKLNYEARLKERAIKRGKTKKDVEVLTALPLDLMDRRILCVDFSTTKTGWAYYQWNKKTTFIRTGLATADKAFNFRKRCFIISEEIKKIILDYNVNLLILEDTFTGANANVAEMLNEGRGYITSICIKYGIEILTVPPNFWKKHIEGMPLKGREQQKERSIEVFKNDLKREPLSDDEADAYCMLKGVFKAYEENKKL